MNLAAFTPRNLYHWSRRLVHPLVDSFLPVDYTAQEYRAQKRKLDPSGSRNTPNRNPDTAGRIVAIGSLLGLDPSRSMDLLDEARAVQLPKVKSDGNVRLPSPMCCEDRFTTYIATRALRPEVAVETGVANGASSAYVLTAMDKNGDGRLISIELSDDPNVGRLVPERLRGRWDLRRGDSLAVMPEVLSSDDRIDLFVHDSWHRCRHVTRELELVWPRLTPGGLMCVHDILANNAFSRFVRRHTTEIGGSLTSVNLGLIRKRT